MAEIRHIGECVRLSSGDLELIGRGEGEGCSQVIDTNKLEGVSPRSLDLKVLREKE
jgi:hypothetical protein